MRNEHVLANLKFIQIHMQHLLYIHVGTCLSVESTTITGDCFGKANFVLKFSLIMIRSVTFQAIDLWNIKTHYNLQSC